jgi:hypothetical protein
MVGQYCTGESAILEALIPIVLQHRLGPLVDIGVGQSTAWLAYYGQVFDVPLLSCDIVREHRALYPEHYHFRCSSIEFMYVFPVDEVAIVHLDGCHDYKVVKEEVDFFFRLLIPGGVIFLHDTYPPSEEYLARDSCSDSFKVRQYLESFIPDTFTWQYTASSVGLTMITKRELNRKFFQW